MEDKTQLDLAKEQADELGLDYHPSIGYAKLRSKINEQLGIDPEPVEKRCSCCYRNRITNEKAYEE